MKTQKLTLVCDSCGDYAFMPRNTEKELSENNYLLEPYKYEYLERSSFHATFLGFKPMKPGQAVEVKLMLEEVI